MNRRDVDGDAIHVRGARQNNLQNVDVTIPRGLLTVITGVSGSGKSSLAFDTLYAEGQRRYVESFSTYARQFLERMDRPDVDAIDGLLPAVALEQRNTIRSARSTLGTLTELTDYLKLLFAKRAVLHCRVCDELVERDHPGSVIRTLIDEHAGARVVITFPFHVGVGDDARVALGYLAGAGYRRVWLKGQAVDTDDLDVDRGLEGSTLVVADRARVTEEQRQRLVESLEAAYQMGQGRATILIEGRAGLIEGRAGLIEGRAGFIEGKAGLIEGQAGLIEEAGETASTWLDLTVSIDLVHCGERHPEPREGLFSFSSPLGACPECNGFGRMMDIDLDRVIPDHSLPLSRGAIRPWRQSARSEERRWLRTLAASHDIDMELPWRDLPQAHRDLVLDGEGEGRRRGLREGVRGWFGYLQRKSYKMPVRILLARYRAYSACPVCEGARLQPDALLYRVGGLHIADTLAQSVAAAGAWLDRLPPAASDRALIGVVDQLRQRLRYLDRVGLGYLTLDRQGRTLSGGELQRANLTSAVGSGLVNTLFVLDEPTIGLHARDTERLSSLLTEMTDRDNTVVVVEHDPDMLRVADHVIDLGPGPGSAGGQIVYAGAPAGLMTTEASATCRALRARAHPRPASATDRSRERGITVRGARAQNLADIDVTLPFGRLTVLTGVSGSGKSTLLDEILHRGILRRRGQVTDTPGDHDDIEGLDAIDEVIWIDQTSPAASPRANPATYVKAWDGIRALFARQPLAQRRGYTPGTFSFNAGKGRCPACEGAGFERVEMQFLSDVFLQCSLCEGARFIPEVLEVTWSGLTIADMLALTVDEAAGLLKTGSAPARKLKVLSEVGLGYLCLGQPLATLSGGEAQRLKIAHHLGLAKTRRGLFLMDEPTTGLHLADVDRLILNLEELAAAGNTVLVVEHHLDVIGAADHVLELGPEGGAAGGKLVFSGAPAALAHANTPTGPHLARWLAGVRPLDDAAPLIRTAAAPQEEGSNASRPAAAGMIEVVGARVHNLRDVSVTLPRRGRTVVSGVSGSGKSSLAFDIIFGEGQRRFLDCLSPYARQYITQLERPDADRIAGIPPTVAIEQRTTRGGGRSTVANVTEIEPFLRLLYARLGEGSATGRDRMTPSALARSLAERWPEGEVAVLAPVIKQRKGFHKPVFRRAIKMGLSEVLVDGQLRAPRPSMRLRRNHHHDVDIVVGRVFTDEPERLIELVERAALLADGEVRFARGQGSWPDVDGPWEVSSEDAAAVRRAQLDPRLFSPRTIVGQCPDCTGAGWIDNDLDPDGLPLVCPSCRGERLGPAGRSVRFGGHRLPELLALSAPGLVHILETLQLDPRGEAVAQGPIRSILERARFLMTVGLSYLTLDRPVRSLSGGEAQRIRLAAQLGAHLSGVLYVLDEPTIGLHPTDTEVLLGALDQLQARGNGVLMVEHDEMTLRTADILVDMGPGAGVEGGEVLVQGPLEAVLADERSVTGACLREPPGRVREHARPLDDATFIELDGVRHHNLDGVSVRIPRGRLTVVTGVSGSGKSSLVHDVLAHAVIPTRGAGAWETAVGLEGLERVVVVDDKPIGKNPRSIPATYVKVWDEIRKLYARLPQAKLRGYTASRFSFNVKGGRCESCAGQGVIKLEMSFLPDAHVPCDGCGGQRFNGQTLQVTWQGRTIGDVLDLSVREASKLFENVPRIARAMGLLDDVGLGYMGLGQPSPTLSGGEAQRIKLVSQLLGRRRDDTVIVLDEPSIGLHMADVPLLLEVVQRLVDAGATVVLIEHNPDVMREADWTIDLGPGAGPDGGHVCYQGPYPGLVGATGSRTGEWLARHM